MIKMMMATVMKLLKQIFNKLDGRAWTGFIWLRIWAEDWILRTWERIFGFRAMGGEGGFLDQLRKCKRLKEGCASWS
jgi:hypothetical protein